MKRDSLRRVTLSVIEKRALIEKYKSSGLSQQAYCKKAGLAWTTFNGWLKAGLGKGVVSKPKSAKMGVKFHEVQLANVSTSSAMVLKLPSGVEVCLGSMAPDLLAELIVGVEKRLVNVVQ